MRAVLLAGGAGTRLRPVVSDVPKPLAPVSGRPFLSYLLDLLKLRGFTEIILSVGYMRDAIIEEYGPSYNGLKIDYAIEGTPLGTGGGLRNALDQVRDFPIFACNADTFLDLDYCAMLREHAAAGAKLSVAVRHLDDAARYGKARLDAGRITAFDSAGAQGPGWINAGVYLFSENLLASESATAAFSFEREFLERHIARLRPAAFRTEAYFIDIGVPEDYARAQTELPERLTALRRHVPR